MELIETCFRINVNVAMCQYSVTLGGNNAHFTANNSVSAYAKYVSGNTVWECRNHAATIILKAGPRQGVLRGEMPGGDTLVKRRNSKWSFTNEPEIRLAALFDSGESTIRLALGRHFPMSGP